MERRFFLGNFVAATQLPSDQISCDTGTGTVDTAYIKHHDIYPFLIIIEYNHADPKFNDYSQAMHNNIIIVVHNYIVVTLYILVNNNR